MSTGLATGGGFVAGSSVVCTHQVRIYFLVDKGKGVNGVNIRRGKERRTVERRTSQKLKEDTS